VHHLIRRSRIVCVTVVATMASLALVACGSSGSGSSGNATSLLTQTFSGTHTVSSGNLSFGLTITPSGSSSLTSPISLSFGGPFQSLGAGKLPKSNFAVTISAQGAKGTIGILSTGTAGYVTLQGTSYQLPAATFQKLESSFAQIASTPGASQGSTTGTFSKLGIHPLDWLENPAVVGSETVAGAATTHIRANVNVSSLLADLNTFLSKASSLGVTGAGKLPTSISSATRQKIAGEVQSPSFDVWTGTSDKTVRKLTIGLTVPVTGTLSTQLGGLSSAQIQLTMQYAQLNQPQTISAPTTVRPYSEFATQLKALLTSVQGVASTATSGAAGATSGTTGTSTAESTPTTITPATGATGATAGQSAKVKRYGQCLAAAHADVAKMQRCASLINGQ
jgi:hypothetical protein